MSGFQIEAKYRINWQSNYFHHLNTGSGTQILTVHFIIKVHSNVTNLDEISMYVLSGPFMSPVSPIFHIASTVNS